ncbi:UxaA family hydrolase [Evansella sp. AB-P1]|uniref:UxaA family hydrolase n=1 Tax=Evansella sp. AB-P1 TaxID=3037653 RepID=UPI00241E430D|nr:UxaA family hydrolase [Evansella sp. AB-P1]MDG5787187.1 UxaA family hydrolase [Evansella sp. AB-P1]
MKDTFQGYVRKNGTVGVRNQIAIIPSVFCSGKVAERIAYQVPGSVYLKHPVGCSQVGEDLEITARTLIEIGKNPNFAGVVVVGLGCERFSPYELADGIAPTEKMLETVVIQDEGDSLKTIQQGVKYARQMQQIASQQQRETVSISKLTVGLISDEVSHPSDAFTNDAIGYFSDLLVGKEGSVILSQIQQLIDGKNEVVNRVSGENLKRRVEKLLDERKTRFKEIGNRGDISNSVTSTVSNNKNEAVNALKKAGTTGIKEIITYKAPPEKSGLLLLDSYGHEGEVATSLVAAGAQMVLFSSGRGTPTGFPGTPVMKISGNKENLGRLKENIDLFTNGNEVQDVANIEVVGNRIYNHVLECASGHSVKSELLGHDELFCITRLP